MLGEFFYLGKFNVGKTLLLLMWNWMGLFLSKYDLWTCWDCLSLLVWIGAFTLHLLLKMPTRKLEPWLILWSFFLLRLLFVSINLSYALAWKISCLGLCSNMLDEYLGLLVLHLLPLLKPWLIVKQGWKWASWQSVEVLLILLSPGSTIIVAHFVLEIFLIL